MSLHKQHGRLAEHVIRSSRAVSWLQLCVCVCVCACVCTYRAKAADRVTAVDSISEELDDRLKCNRSVGQSLWQQLKE